MGSDQQYLNLIELVAVGAKCRVDAARSAAGLHDIGIYPAKQIRSRSPAVGPMSGAIAHDFVKTNSCKIPQQHQRVGPNQPDPKPTRIVPGLTAPQCHLQASDTGGTSPLPKNMLVLSQVIVDYLIRQRVPYAFGLCGHGNIQFIDALYERSSDIKTISVHHETVAGFMADVY